MTTNLDNASCVSDVDIVRVQVPAHDKSIHKQNKRQQRGHSNVRYRRGGGGSRRQQKRAGERGRNGDGGCSCSASGPSHRVPVNRLHMFN